MTRKLKVLGLALVAMFAMSAVAASAQAAQFQAAEYPASITAHSAESDNFFVTDVGIVECSTHHFEGSANEATTTLTVVPIYKNCEAFGLEAEVDTNSCHYLFHLHEGSGPVYTMTVDIDCTETGDAIKVITPACVITVPEQNGLTHVLAENAGGDVAIEAEVGGIEYEKEGAICSGVGTEGEYFGSALVEGFNEFAEPNNVFIE